MGEAVGNAAGKLMLIYIQDSGCEINELKHVSVVPKILIMAQRRQIYLFLKDVIN